MVKKFPDDHVGTATELRGLFKIHFSMTVDDILQQFICSIAKKELKKPGEK